MRNNVLSCHNTQQFVVSLWAAQAKGGDQDAANVQASLDGQLQIALSQPVDVVVCCELFALCLTQTTQDVYRLAQLFEMALDQVFVNRQHLAIETAAQRLI